jgi:cytochrome c peroxidase
LDWPVDGVELTQAERFAEQAPQEGARPGVLLLPPDSLPPTEALMGAAQPLGLATLPAEPTGNPRSVAAVELGRRLFFDPLLSADRTVSCATCHQPDHGLASPEPLAVGIGGRVGRRNAPSLFNRVYGQRFFWDGRADSLEAQSLLPIANPEEMGDDLDAILLRLAEHPEYPRLFEAAFSHSAGSAAVTAEHMAAALAAFQRTLLLGDSPVDRFRSASDVSGLSLEARQGLWIFESRGRCWQCHSGENFSDEQFHNTGVGFGADNRDVGRFEVTGVAEDRFRFKTPSLRGVAQTAPYMHDGSVRTLEDVVEFYNRGGATEDRELSPLMRPLNLSDEEKRYLVEFLRALSYQAGPSAAK